jgi:hypothetical protein
MRKSVEVGKVVIPELPLRQSLNAIPMVGFHSQSAEIEYQGKKYDFAIGGGCQTITIRTNPEKSEFYSVSISEILPAILEAIAKAEGENL